MVMNAIRKKIDPVLGIKATEITEITENLDLLTKEMLATMYSAHGIGLAAPQIGIQKDFCLRLGNRSGSDKPEIKSQTENGFLKKAACVIPGLSWE